MHLFIQHFEYYREINGNEVNGTKYSIESLGQWKIEL